MNSFRNFLKAAVHESRATKNRMTRYGIAGMAILIIGVGLILTVHAEQPEPFRFNLVPASDTIGRCLPNASAAVSVLPRGESQGVDTLDLKAEGLPPQTEFAVFLTELADSPIGAAQYIGDFTTNAAGRGSM